MALLETTLSMVVDTTLGSWLGSMVFFSFIAAPTTFDVLGDDAGRVVNAIFPKYYAFGQILGFTAFTAVLVAGSEGMLGSTLSLSIQVLLLVALSATIYSRAVLVPRMKEAGDDGFARYHGQSVLLNGVAMLAVAGGLVLSHL
ncbi:DUF4149 domain-containing protein [Haladaptatus salinisoli]|uniref:DUF4149 domain-containing protein n=1 Tax=Haladaptatus salinisoli TaxID=2884876 RepID=UPI001D0B75A0|nr:DUF4149 domain-containing protein [Haladaptatus salinisoli]